MILVTRPCLSREEDVKTQSREAPQIVLNPGISIPNHGFHIDMNAFAVPMSAQCKSIQSQTSCADA